MQVLKQLSKHAYIRWASAVAVVLFALVLAVNFNSKQIHAENSRVITIFHDGLEQTIVTDAATVADALSRLNVKLDKYDNVEPERDTKLTAPNYNINVYRARPVVVVDGQNRYEVMSAATSAEEIVRSVNLALYPEDTTDLQRIDDFVADGGVGLKLIINRATPVNLVLYNKQYSVRTQSQIVGDLLKEKSVNLGSDDGTNLSLNTKVTAGLTVQVWRNGVQTVTEEQPIAFTTRQIFDVDQPLGYKQVQTPGVLGKKSVTFEINMRNGIEISRKEIQSVVLSQPHQQVEVVGSKPPVNLNGIKTELMAMVGISQADWNYVDYILSHESGWCATKLQGRIGYCPAVAPDSIPSGLGYGLCQSTPGYKMASAGADWQTNPITQLKWCNSYALSRYGSWLAAYNYWIVHRNW